MVAAAMLAACQNAPEAGDQPANENNREQLQEAVQTHNGKKVQPPNLVGEVEREMASQKASQTGEIDLRTPYKYIESHPDYAYFFKIVSQTSYAKVLHNQSITVIAPTNAAIQGMSQAEREALLATDGRTEREVFAARHIIEHAYPAEKIDRVEDLKDMRGVRIVGGSNPDGPISLNGLEIPRIDLQIGRGILISTNTVMPNATIKETPKADPGLQNFGNQSKN